MPDRLSIYNNALMVAGEETLLDLTENRPARYKLDQVWDSGFLRGCLEQGDWNFAMRSVRLEPSASVKPDFGFEYAYEKPTDWVRTSAFCSDPFFKSPIDGNGYSDEAGFWFSSHPEIYVQYVSDDPNYGLDLARWPQSFTNWVEHDLAKRVFKRLTGASSDFETLKTDTRKALSDARFKDGRNQGAAYMPRGNWSKARGGGVYDRRERR